MTANEQAVWNIVFSEGSGDIFRGILPPVTKEERFDTYIICRKAEWDYEFAELMNRALDHIDPNCLRRDAYRIISTLESERRYADQMSQANRWMRREISYKEAFGSA